MLAMPKLALDGISKSFHARGQVLPVVERFSLSVADLEFVAVIGPSGCGKSTILRIIDGLIEPDAGEIRIDGRAVRGPGHGRAMVFQSFDLFPWRTTLHNVAFGLEMTSMSRAERLATARRYIDMVGLRGFEDAYPHQLSGGMQQRVGIARALAIDPGVLLMDEPFGALDVQTRDLLQDELLRIWETHQKTVLFVTHNIEEAIYLADRIVVMTYRPGTVKRDMLVDMPRVRDPSSAAFNALKRELGQLVMEEQQRHHNDELRMAAVD
jgi:NitT/TauT family transport system ATP-binding protein